MTTKTMDTIATALDVLGFDTPNTTQAIFKCWNERHRGYHSFDHLEDIVDRITSDRRYRSLPVNGRARVIVAAAFHDAVYEPRRDDNEARSADLMRRLYPPRGMRSEDDETSLNLDKIEDMIIATRHHAPTDDDETAILLAADMAVVTEPEGFERVLAWERGIAKEYQFLDYSQYAPLRVALLEKWARENPENRYNLLTLSDYVKSHRPRVGVYAGSFNPFHRGHMNVLEKAEQVFDKVIVAQGINPAKGAPDFKLVHGAEFPKPGVRDFLRHRQVEQYNGLLTDFLKEKGQRCEITLVRGLRNGDDLNYEVNQSRVMRDLMPEIRIVFIQCDPEFGHISSTLVRQLDTIKPEIAVRYHVTSGDG